MFKFNKIAGAVLAMSAMIFLGACNAGGDDDDGLTALLLANSSSGTSGSSSSGSCATTQSSAVFISVGSSASARVSSSSWCYFRFTASSTSTYTVTLDPGSTDKDLYMSFEDGAIGTFPASANWQYSSSNVGTVNDSITQTTTSSSRRYLGVYDFNGTGGTFTISVSN